MKCMDNAALLRHFVETCSDEAFELLVSRHFNLVYGSALRMVGGDAHLAKDVAQKVFTDLAQKARRLPPGLFLGGWLYKHTCFTAANAVRTERRRQSRETQAAEIMNDSPDADAVWQRVAPILDEAMRDLKSTDRDAVILRFFERQPFRLVGQALGTSEDGARKRVDRALEKMRSLFAARGWNVSSMVLAGAMEMHAADVAPPGLSSVVAKAALAGSASSGGAGLLLKLMTITKTQIAVGAVLTALAATLVAQSQTNTKLQNENRALREQAAQLDSVQAENERQRNASSSVAPAMPEEEMRELARLRAQVGRLRDQLSETKKENARKMAAAQKDVTPDVQDQFKQAAVAKMTYSKDWAVACLEYAQAHQNTFPTNLDQVTPFLPDEAKGQTNLTPDELEITYQGLTTAITNFGDSIILREKEPMQKPDGGWLRVYVFGDGHSQLRLAADGDFSSYENNYLPIPIGQ
jgi:RNA polymerase sigma factor (sigma-70 family)